ncbi:MAG: alanyl-tRNA editing protein [Myxococcales bacterium]|nr:alanyl-tRNA editing protein [Myxococcales bacterium]
MATEKLYWKDAFATEVDARVVAVADWKGTPSVVLDRTVFYPEGGGQLADRGALVVGDASVPVVDVQVDDEGRIHHVLAAPWAHGETTVRGAIEVARRRDFMSQHTGQHLLSAALAVVCKGETVSSRLGAESSTIDLDLVTLDPRALADAEALVNERVLADLDVVVTFPTSDELRALPLRRAPKVSEGIRVVTVAGLDCSPCGGTHCARTGQVGWVHATGIERYKGGTRVTFLAGARAHADATRKEAVLRDLARELTCGVLDVGAAVGKLRSDLRSKTDAFAATRGELLRLVAERVHRERPPGAGPTRIVLHREQEDLGGLRSLAAALAARPDVIAFVGARDPEKGDLLVVVERGSGVTEFDCGKWFKERLARGARGGGRPERAEGRLPPSMSLEEET